MFFTVSMPGGPRDFEFDAYIRLLEKRGIDVVDTLRVLDPVTGSRWLHAWTDEPAADSFLRELEQTTEDDRWRLYSLEAGQTSQGPLGPLDILVSQRSDGCVYSLKPFSQRLIARCFPSAVLAPHLFISTPTQFDLQRTHGPIWDQIARILTGLSEDQLRDMGGYRVIEAGEQRVLRPALLQSA